MRTTTILLLSMQLVGLLPAQRALLEQLPPDGDAYEMRADALFEDLVRLPGEGPIQGLAKVETLLWIARGADLFAVQWPGLQLQTKVRAPEGVLALAADGRFLYALRASGIQVLDPIAGRVVRELPAEDDGLGATAMTHHEGALLVAGAKAVLAVDPKTGKTLRESMDLGQGAMQWLASDGANVWAGGAAACRRFVPGESPRWLHQRAWPSEFETSTATWIGARLLFAGEQRDAKGGWVQVCGLLDPRGTLPAEILSLQLFAGDDGVQYQIGPKPLAAPEKLTAELARIRRLPVAQVSWPDDTVRLLPVVIEPYPGVCMREVCKAWDLVVAAGYDVRCPAQEAWARKNLRGKADSTVGK